MVRIVVAIPVNAIENYNTDIGFAYEERKYLYSAKISLSIIRYVIIRIYLDQPEYERY